MNGAISIANADIAAINSRLTGISIASILPVRMEFEPARTVLINNFATLQTDIQQALSTIAPGSPLLAPSSLDGVYVSAPIQSSQAGEITAFTVDRNGRESQANRIYSGTNDLIFGGIDEAGVSGGNDTLRGASGDDLFIGGLGADLHDGGAGEDTVSYLRSASGVTVDLQGTGLGGQAAGDTYISIENILGSPNADTITGNGANNTIIGFEGNDVLDGGGGDDILFGYVGNDELDGGEGTDTAVFSDIFDNYEFQLSADGQTITAIHSGGSGIDGTDTLTNIEFGQFQDRNVSLSGIDLTFVIDATGSMFDDIAAVQSQVTQIIQQTAENVPFTRFSLVTYRDPGQTQTDSPFTADTSQIISAINNISVGGGGDFPEGVNSGLLHALRNEQGLGPWRPSPTPRSIILIGDAPARDTELRSEVIALANSETISIDETILLSSTSTLALASSFATATATSEPTLLPVQPVTIFPIAIGGNSQTLADFQEIATATGGTLLTAVNASDIVSVLLDAIEQATQFPIALPDFATTTSTDITLLDLLANDSDPNGDSLSLVEIEGIAIVPGAEILISSGALLSVNSDGTVTYNPNNQFNELAEGEIFSDTFTYTITDGNGTDSALATIEIAGTLPLILGTEELETLAGTSEGERLDGLGGDDTLKGFGGNDLILGGDGDDSLKGGSGTDKLMGASGADSLDGGDGDDLLQGGSENDFLRGGQGNDTLEGGEGNDELMDTQGDDVLDGGNGLDTLKGGLDNDSLLGGNDDDILLGNSGNDTLVGGAGNDQLTGGQDADLFVLAAGEGKDTVVDFRIAQNDRFGLSGDLAFEQLIFTASTASSGTDILFADEILATVENITISALNNAELFVTL
ncbi:Ig-like domain-containing protein [Synechococcus sp. PCC 7336]|uniref:Ig-like domain-containing protein n=1 Tax=Synechococcus sp. PCC 7336 TaxID=195250 RepID=UPI00138AFBB1|nr:Ig-like domain-containing protein [Synechococcus sp. PCC 7336]